MAQAKEFRCKGLNYSVIMRSDKMILENAGWKRSEFHELPMPTISAVIVRRKSIVPFAAFTTLAVITAVLTRYNALWFLVNLSAWEQETLSVAAITAAALCAIPTVSRALFVDIVISWTGKPKSFLIRFVPAKQGRALPRRFHGASTGR